MAVKVDVVVNVNVDVGVKRPGVGEDPLVDVPVFEIAGVGVMVSVTLAVIEGLGVGVILSGVNVQAIHPTQ